MRDVFNITSSDIPCLKGERSFRGRSTHSGKGSSTKKSSGKGSISKESSGRGSSPKERMNLFH
jgi:hypothetical protein